VFAEFLKLAPMDRAVLLQSPAKSTLQIIDPTMIEQLMKFIPEKVD